MYLNLPLIIGVALFRLHILEGADTACRFGHQSHIEFITRAYIYMWESETFMSIHECRFC